MFKRILAGILTSTLILGVLTACSSGGGTATGGSSSGGSSGSTAGSAAGQAKTESRAKITLIMSARDEFLSTMERGTIEAAEKYGVEINSVDAQLDTAKMLQFIETARNNGNDAVILNIVDSQTSAEAIEAAGEMKLVFVNRMPSDMAQLNENVVYVGSDELQSGKLQGDYLADYFKSQGKTEINYVLLSGIIGHLSTENRTKSVLNALKDNGIKATAATAPLNGEYDRAKAMDKFMPILGTAPFDCIISNNDAMALGAIEAMEQKGMDPKEIPIVGIDATPDGRAAIKLDKMKMSSFQNGQGQGYGSVMAALNLLEGKPINEGTEFELDETGRWLIIPFEAVTKDNVSEYDNR